MKRAFLISAYATLCSIILFSCQEKTAGVSTEKEEIPKELMISEAGLGDLKMGMTVPQVEEALKGRIKLMNQNTEDVWIDSANVLYKGEEIRLYFDRRYLSDDEWDLVLGGIKSTSQKFRTSGGIGIGSDKKEIWDAYHEGMFSMYPDFIDTTYTTRSKTRFFINVSSGDGENQLMFTVDSNKVRVIEVARDYHDEH